MSIHTGSVGLVKSKGELAGTENEQAEGGSEGVGSGVAGTNPFNDFR